MRWHNNDDQSLVQADIDPKRGAGASPHLYRRHVTSDWGTYLRTARVAAGLRQVDLATRADVHVTTIIDQEKGALPRTPEILDRLCRVVNIDKLDALRVIYQLDDAPAEPLPAELATIVRQYAAMGPVDRQDLLAHLGLIVEWAAARLAASGRGGRRSA